MPDASYQARKAKYGQLAGHPRQTLNADDARSAVFLAAEQQSRRNGAPRDEIVTPANAAKWVTAARHLETLVAQLGRFPHETVPGAERASAIWVRYQRRQWDSLCHYQRDWLESIPGFYRDPLGEREDAQVANYTAVVEQINRAPKRTSDNPAEVRAARWATKQRILYRQGKLPKHRVDELSELKYWQWTVLRAQP